MCLRRQVKCKGSRGAAPRHSQSASGQGLEGLGRPVFPLLGAFVADSHLVVTKSPVRMPSFLLVTEYF